MPWSLAYIQQHAARHGFIAGSVPGRLVLPSPDDGAPPVLALGMDALIVDDHGRQLDAHGFAAIGEELKRLYRLLEAHDIAAGSAVARRLFS